MRRGKRGACFCDSFSSGEVHVDANVDFSFSSSSDLDIRLFWYFFSRYNDGLSCISFHVRGGMSQVNMVVIGPRAATISFICPSGLFIFISWSEHLVFALIYR